jgi:hypothetical protein
VLRDGDTRSPRRQQEEEEENTGNEISQQRKNRLQSDKQTTVEMI